jgi:hypothetical protein
MEKLRTRSGVSWHYHNTLFVNVFASSGNTHRKDSDHFFNTELMYLTRHAPYNWIAGGDFNCGLFPLDCSNEFRPHRIPESLLMYCRLNDTLTNTPTRRLYTHYTQTTATRLDRIHTALDMLSQNWPDNSGQFLFRLFGSNIESATGLSINSRQRIPKM